VYFDTSWIRVFMIFYLIVANLNSFSYRRLSIVKRSCRFSRQRDIDEDIYEKMNDFTIFFDCLRSRTKWLKRCWRNRQKDDTSSWKEIVFYEKYHELVSHSCQTKDFWDAWSEFEFWKEIINFFLCCDDRFYVDIMIFFINWLINYIRFVSSSRSMRFR
jgi:hypothetical protein